MELKYRGISYDAFASGGQTIETQQMGIYRSIPYRTKSVKASLHQPGEEFIYRGVRYTR